jgi:hypothetical protein
LILVEYIHKPDKKNSASYFPTELERHKFYYPLLLKEYNDLNTTLDKMTIEQRHGLKLTLLREMKTHRANTDREIGGEKLLLGETLPTDPDECIARMEAMYKEGEDKIAEINSNFKTINKARGVIFRIRENKRALANSIYDEDYFSSMPDTAVHSKGSKMSRKK